VGQLGSTLGKRGGIRALPGRHAQHTKVPGWGDSFFQRECWYVITYLGCVDWEFPHTFMRIPAAGSRGSWGLISLVARSLWSLHTHTCAHTHTNICTHIHTYIHTYIHNLIQPQEDEGGGADFGWVIMGVNQCILGWSRDLIGTPFVLSLPWEIARTQYLPISLFLLLWSC